MVGIPSDEAPTEQAVDFREFLEMVGDDREFLDDFITLFDQDASRLVIEVVEASSRLDAPALQRTAHALKGLLSHFGGSKAFDLCQFLESAGFSKDLKGTDERTAELALEVGQIRRALADLRR